MFNNKYISKLCIKSAERAYIITPKAQMWQIIPIFAPEDGNEQGDITHSHP